MSVIDKAYKPTVLCILDGWGHREGNAADDAITHANTPNWDALMAECPHSLLATSGEAVGLPAGQMGNSEVGHMTIGAGRVMLQDLPRISKAVESGALAEEEDFIRFIHQVKYNDGRVHLMGLCSDGGVHAHIDHILGMANIIAAKGTAVVIHAFMDGRDTPPKSGLAFM